MIAMTLYLKNKDMILRLPKEKDKALNFKIKFSLKAKNKTMV